MKIINLLNKIANGEEVPKKIYYNGKIWNYENSDYFASDYGYLFDRYNVSGMLNDEIKIIEEEKKAPTLNDIRESYGLPRIEKKKIPEKIEYYDDSIAWVIDGIGQLSDVDKVIVDKLNEVLDYLKSKGE